MPSTWDAAYLRQAESDFGVFLLLKDREDVAVCHKLHYLQMASEKLAKAFFASRSRGRKQQEIHEVLVTFIRATVSHAPVVRAFHKQSKKAYADYLKQEVLPVAAELLRLYPKGGTDEPNLEYPWQTKQEVLCPLDYCFANLDPGSDRVKKFVWYLKTSFLTADVW